MNIVVTPKAIHVVVLYSSNGYAAERSVVVSDLVPIVISEMKDRFNITYVDYTNTSKLSSMYLFGVRIYISALSSSACTTLHQSFFSSRTDAIHINSYSTSSALNTYGNLLRNLTSDDYTGILYSKLMMNRSTFIIYDPNSTWSTGLKDNINSYKTCINIASNTDYIGILESFTTVSPDATIVVLDDDNSTVILTNIVNANITFNYELLLGDALYEYQFPSIAQQLQSHNTMIVMPFTTTRQEEYATYVNNVLNNPSHPASELVSYFKQLFDIALLWNEGKSSFVNLYTPITIGQYSIKPYNDNGVQYDHGYGLVDGTAVIIGYIM